MNRVLRNEKWALIGLILCAFALRVYHLDHFSLWMDEGLTPLRSSYSVRDILRNVIVIQGFESEDTHPALYYLVIHATRQLFGLSDFAFRYPSVLFSVLLLPLMWRFGRKMHRPQLGLLAAALVAINPQQVWYAQEARMYPQLLLLMTTASYVLWRAWAGTRRPLWHSLALYGLFAALAAYTHYTALFVILAQGLVWLFILWRAGNQRLIGAALLAGAVGAAPFVPFIVRRAQLGPEANYTLIQPQVILADIVRGFGFGRTVSYSDPLIAALLLVMVALLLYGILRSPADQRNFLLVCLLAAPLGLIAGSYLIKPMYLGPHHIMTAAPAFILLIATAIAHMPWSRIGVPLALLAVALAQGLSLSNLYNDGLYAKEDYRALVQFVEARAGKHDLVLYNNAILLPLHMHYQQRNDLPVTASPIYPYSLDDPNNTPLEQVVAGYERVWFMPASPNNGTDEDGAVAAWLSEQGDRFSDGSFHGRNSIVGIWGIGMGRAFASPPDGATVRTEPPLAVAVSGVEHRTLWAELYWSAEQAQTGRLVTVQLRDPAGGVWANIDAPIPVNSDTTQLVRSLHGLPLPIGLPPATYQLWANYAGWQPIADVQIDGVVSAENPPQSTITYANGIALVSVDFADDTTFPGNPLPATALWRINSAESAAASRYEIIVTGRDGELRRDTGSVLADWVATDKLAPGDLVAMPFGIYPRPDTRSGPYALEWQLLEGDVPQAVADGRGLGNSAELGSFEVLDWPLATSVPVDNLVDSGDNSFGEAISLLGHTGSASKLQPGQTLELTLYWKTLAQPANNWQVFIHLVKVAGEQPLAQANGTPVGGLRPSTGWRVDEVITDTYQLALPPDLAPGEYELYVGLFDGDSFVRNPVVQAGQQQPFDQLLLTKLIVE